MVSATSGNAARAVAVAEHEVGARPLVAAAGDRRHRMAVDQDGGAEFVVQPREQAAQRAVIGLVEPVDPPHRLVNRNALIVDFLGIADDARHGAEAARDPHRAGIGERRQPAVEHARIELVGLAIDVDVAAREMRPHQRDGRGRPRLRSIRRRRNPRSGAASSGRAARRAGRRADRSGRYGAS